MTLNRSLVEDELAALNELARETFDRIVPAPDGLPPTGSWIRATKIDMDARGTPAGPWHLVVGWDGLIGCLSTRCRRRPHGTIIDGLGAYLGQAARYRWVGGRYALLVETERPAEGACGQCDRLLARDAA